MLRRTAAVVPALCLVLTGCLRLEAPAPDVQPGREAPPLLEVEPAGDADTARLEPSCPAPEQQTPVLSADQLNQMVTDSDLPFWQAADVGASAVLSDGRVLWVFGDTLRKRPTRPQLIDNAVVVTSGTCMSQLVTDDLGAVFPRDPGELSHWPMSLVRLEPTEAHGEDVRDVVAVYLSRIQRGERQWDFMFRGTSVAVLEVGADGVPRLASMQHLTPDSVSFDQINWGAAAAVDGDWLYLYGTRQTGEASVYGRELYVSRVPADEPANPAAMMYWDGSEWQPDAGRVVPIMGAVDGTSQTLSVDLVDGTWTAISKRGGDLADEITMWTSDQPYGPWTAAEVGRSPSGQDSGNLQYTPLAHPDIQTPSGRLLVSVSRNTTGLEELVKFPQLGRILFTEVPRP
ncbi:DUF4185 domain-containing protein [Blastococcus goldschmidtiae]|uniref:DUF4185 domain-containing protein n=1 Tax=Blastococcus goldschmidtiae TaxID=3075546 RepID=A0ABU2K567_9ACTN|nr:DUF4185 domain-containing protein [Blastococcus sp. DSM 46792]MDT0275334.1 DUF4185 domain-containing protein [Blastococcus sp. DSM 46792]